MSESNCTNPKTSADCGQHHESTAAHKAAGKTGEATNKTHEEHQSNCTNPKISADCGQRLESTAHEAGRKTGEAITKSNDELAHGVPSSSQANQKPVHAFNESTDEMKDKMNPLEPPKAHGHCATKK